MAADNTLGVREALSFGLVLLESSVISVENREQLAVSDHNIFDHRGLLLGR